MIKIPAFPALPSTYSKLIWKGIISIPTIYSTHCIILVSSWSRIDRSSQHVSLYGACDPPENTDSSCRSFGIPRVYLSRVQVADPLGFQGSTYLGFKLSILWDSKGLPISGSSCRSFGIPRVYLSRVQVADPLGFQGSTYLGFKLPILWDSNGLPISGFPAKSPSGIFTGQMFLNKAKNI